MIPGGRRLPPFRPGLPLVRRVLQETNTWHASDDVHRYGRTMAAPGVGGTAPCAPRRPRPRRPRDGSPPLRKRIVGALLQRRAGRRREKLADARDVRLRPACLPDARRRQRARVGVVLARLRRDAPRDRKTSLWLLRKQSKSDERPEPARDELGTQHGAALGRGRGVRARRSR